MENQYSTKAKQQSIADRYSEFWIFPSSVYAGLKQNTQFYNGATVLFDRTEPTTGFIVGDGRKGLVLTCSEFYSGISLETLLDTEYLPKWICDNFDGFGTWHDPVSENISIDPIDLVPGRWTAIALGLSRGETCIWDVVNGITINTKRKSAC